MKLVISVLYLLGQAILALAILLCFPLWPLIRRWARRSSLKELGGPPSSSYLIGNLKELFHPRAWERHRQLVKKYGGAFKVHGLFGEEIVYLSDPKALKHVLLEQQDVYERTEFFLKINLVCLGPSLVSLAGAPHKKQRRLLSPIFSPNQIKSLTPIFWKVSDELRNAITRQLDTFQPPKPAEIDMLHWIKNTALELIGQGGLGYSFGRLDDTTVREYSDAVRNFAPMLTRAVVVRQFLPFFSELGTASFRRWAVRWIPIDSVQKIAQIVEVMEHTAKLVFSNRMSELQGGGNQATEKDYWGDSGGKDLMSILLAENEKTSKEDRLSEEELTGLISTFIFGGQDTTTGAILSALHELAIHQDAQECLREEVSASGDEHLSFNDIQDLKYLDAVVRETLRMHPPVYIAQRTNTIDDTIPLSRPVRSADGTTWLSSLPLQKNTTLLIALEAANRDPDLWGPDAAEWRPARWFSPLSKAAEEGLPSIYSHIVTFFAGNRSCIGFKFAELEMKIVLSVLVRNFRFELPREKSIAWKLGGIVSPGVEDDPIPKLPLLVSRLPPRTVVPLTS